MKNNFKIKLAIMFAFMFLFVQSAFAATLSVSPDKATLNKGDTFTATIFLNTEGQYINAIKGDLVYNANYLKAETVNIGDSFVSFWVEKPGIQTAGDINFSGVIPGGVVSNQLEVFKVIFRTQNSSGDASLLINNPNLYLNDGQGSIISPKIKNANIKISDKKSTENAAVVVLDDKVPPEKFNITRTRDPSIFDNKWFIDFSTIDKGSGVDHYQVCELFKCVTAENPFSLFNQTPFYYIRVKAYDINGNMRSSMIVSVWFVLLVILLIIIICSVGVYFYRKVCRYLI